MQTEKLKYEVLLRYGQDGELQGVHRQHRFVTRDDDGVVGEFLGPAEPVALEDLAGLMVEAGAESVVAVTRLTAERDAALARVADLEAQLAAFAAPAQ